MKRITLMAVSIVLLLFGNAAHSQDSVFIQQIEWSPDGIYLAAATTQGVHIYDSELTLVSTAKSDALVHSVSWEAESDHLVIVAEMTGIEIWDVDTTGGLTYASTIPTSRRPVYASWSPSGEWIAFATLINSAEWPYIESIIWQLHIWDVSSDSLVSSTDDYYYSGPTPSLENQIAWHPLGNPEIAVGAARGVLNDQRGTITVTERYKIRLLNAMTADETAAFSVTGYPEEVIAWHPNGNAIAYGTETSFGVMDLSGNVIVGGPAFIGVRTLDWRSDGSYLLMNEEVHNQDLEYIGYVIPEQIEMVRTVRWRPNGNEIAFLTGVALAIDDPTQLPDYDPLNESPVAVAQYSYSGFPPTSMTLDGSLSYDADGTIVSYVWSINGEEIAGQDTSTPTATTGAPGIGPGFEYDLMYTLVVTDDDGATASAVFWLCSPTCTY
jgi:WD40 repeat protein